MAIYGNTVLLKGTFTDADGTATDPTTITLTIYDQYKRELSEISIGAAQKISTGVYGYSYTLPDGEESIYYEYKGIIDSEEYLNRAKIDKAFYTS